MNSTFWTISRRIMAGFAICVLITAGLGLFAMRQVESLTTNISDLNDNVIPSLVLISDISDGFQDIMVILEQLDGETSAERIIQLEKTSGERNALVEDCLKKYEPLVISEEDGRLLKEIRRTYESFYAARNRAIELIKQNQTAEINQQMHSIVTPLYEKTEKAIDEHTEFNIKLGQSQATKGKMTAKATDHWLKVLLLSALLVASLIAWAISSTTNRVLRGLAMSLDHGASQTAAAARQVSVASQNLSSGASEQASSVEETSASLEEMTSMIRATSENAQKAAQKAVEVALAYGSELIVATIFEVPLEGFVFSPEIWDKIGGEARQIQEAVVTMAREKGVRKVEAVLRHGSTYQELIKLAMQVKAGIILLGAKKKSGMFKFKLGNVMERVISNGSIPVWVVNS